MKYILFVFPLLINIQTFSMELPQGQKAIAKHDNLEIYIKAFDSQNENLKIDTISAFDISSTSFARKNWGQIVNKNIKINGNTSSFEEDNGKAFFAFHIYPDQRQNIGLVFKFIYDLKNLEAYVYELQGTTINLLKKEQYSLPADNHILNELIINLTTNSNNWKNSIIDFNITSRNLSLPRISVKPVGKSSSWKFWKK